MRYDWVVVGAGLTGATLAERLARALDQRVLVVDRRPHVAGNAHDVVDEHGLLLHRYGAHIFHTQSARVWHYLSRFTDWRPYRHRVLGEVDGALVPIPFNLTTLRTLVPADRAAPMERQLVDLVGAGKRIPVLKLLDHPDPHLRELGEFVYDRIFAAYSAKQWGCRPEELDRAVTGRVPVVVSTENTYFNDAYQGIPVDGYTAMVDRMLDHRRITIAVGTDYTAVADRADRVAFTGPIDELLGHRFGPLPYRSLRFETVYHEQEYAQPVAVLNYPDDRPSTRSLEHKHLTGQHHPGTVVTWEYPQEHVPGRTEPYYPLPTAASREAYKAYRSLAEADSRFLFAGRLADYRYYNMDQAVNRALVLFRERLLGGRAAAAAAVG